MRNFYIVIILIFSGLTAASQCTTGYNSVSFNWDYLDFIVSTGSYAPFITQAQSQTQKFSFGTQGVTVTHNYITTNTFGEVSNHTAEAGSFGAGDDIRFKDNGTVTFTFDQPVLNLKFSVYDIDRDQQINVTALNGAAGTNVNVATFTGTILSVNNNNTSNVKIDASITNAADNSSNGTANITVAGAVTSVTLTVTQTATDGTNEDGSFYISDLSACSAGTFPNNYYAIAKPFTNQPAYVVAVVDHTIYFVDVATGKSKLLFDDPAGFNINSMAYDSYNKIVYYTNSLTVNPAINKTIYKYDYNTGIKSVFVANVNTLGIPTYYPGVESGAAAFYNGALYLGVEGAGQPSGATGSARSGYTGRESTIWKIDLDASLNAVSAKQVYGLPVDNGSGNALHDWSDFGLNDGMLYDFDGAASNLDVYQQNLLTGATVNYDAPPFNPRQTSIDWTGKVYNVGSPLASATATIVPYLLNGTINSAQSYAITFNGTALSGSWGDAGEAFKPKTDFGDAPATYDPAGSDPATHEIVPNLHLGTAVGIEFVKKTSSDASGDGAEEDGVGGSQAIATGTSNYGLMISVFNNTGAAATLCGWIDKNGNGIYETGEGATATVPSSTVQQSIALAWPAINVTLAVSAKTFLRLRVTSATNGMTTANPTGYYNDGEVEDFPMIVTVVLPAHPVTLNAEKTTADKVKLSWKIGNEEGYQSYELQKSTDGKSWSAINEKDALGSIKEVSYIFTDVAPATPISFYRVKILKKGGAFEYSNISTIDFNTGNSISVSPNPASSYSTIKIKTAIAAKAQLNIIDYTDRKVFDKPIKLIAGTNDIKLPVVQQLSAGIYKVLLRIDNQVLITSLVIIK